VSQTRCGEAMLLERGGTLPVPGGGGVRGDADLKPEPLADIATAPGTPAREPQPERIQGGQRRRDMLIRSRRHFDSGPRAHADATHSHSRHRNACLSGIPKSNACVGATRTDTLGEGCISAPPTATARRAPSPLASLTTGPTETNSTRCREFSRGSADKAGINDETQVTAPLGPCIPDVQF